MYVKEGRGNAAFFTGAEKVVTPAKAGVQAVCA
jgi:hypothetical protein